MGHLEPGGAPGGKAQVLSDPIWALWRGVVSEFSLLRMLRTATRSRAGWGMHTVDLAGSLRRTPMAVSALARLEGVSDGELARLTELAELNARRNEALWRMIVVLYVSVPVTAVLVGLQAAPELVATFLREGSTLLWLAILAMAVSMLYYLAVLWRARQIVAVLDLARIERAAPAPAQSPRRRP